MTQGGVDTRPLPLPEVLYGKTESQDVDLWGAGD
jgi:hypothetical protein